MDTARQAVDHVVAAAELDGIRVTRALARRRIKFLIQRGKTTEDAVTMLTAAPHLLVTPEALIGRRDPTGREASLRADGDLAGPDSEAGFIPTQQFKAPVMEAMA